MSTSPSFWQRWSTRLEPFKRWLEPKAIHPGFALVLTLAVALTGALASIYSEEIRQTLFQLGGGVSLPATGFWLIFFLTGLLFGIQRWAELRVRAREQGRLEDSTQRLMDAVRTMPPRSFLDEYGAIYRRCEQAAFAVLHASDEPPTIEDVQYALRTVLFGFAELAIAFEDEPVDVPYAANIMLFLSADDLSEAQQDAVDERLKFCEHETTVRRLRGVLDLRCDLSASTDKTGAEDVVDETLEPFALAIPAEDRETIQDGDAERSRILPGGPRAWVKRRLELYTDAADVLNWCREEGAFGDTVMQELRAYFVGDEPPQVGSFLSSHLALGDGEPVGVVNIHRAAAGILKNQKGSADLFINASRPFQVLLIRLLQELKRLEFDAYGTWQHLSAIDGTVTVATNPTDT